MNTGQTHTEYILYPARLHTLRQRQAQRRKVLGLVLITVGSLLLILRVSGQVGDVPWPLTWVAEAIGLSEFVNLNHLVMSVPLAACGMLAADSVQRTQ